MKVHQFMTLSSRRSVVGQPRSLALRGIGVLSTLKAHAPSSPDGAGAITGILPEGMSVATPCTWLEDAMRGRFIGAAGSLLVAISLCGCGLESATYTPQSPARFRAANEFDCPDDELVVVHRPDLSASTVDISGCGHTGRYTCFGSNQRSPACVREPMD
jgi:hypothetical protein